MLQRAELSELKNYLIMERIVPPEIKAYMVRQGKLKECLTYSEIGIFTCVFIDSKKPEPLVNHTYGRLFRTKGIENDEGGINTGFAVID